jgi:transcription antitermination factor NusB
VKGRRRARRAALQALYELDQSGHGIERILAGRFEDVYRSALGGGLPAGQQRVVDHLLATALDERGRVSGAELGELPARLGVDAAGAAEALRALARVQPQAEYTNAIVRGVARHRERLDATIARIAPEWPVEQMAPVDRNILRIALWELGRGASPVRVAINEAVELARLFSGEGSRRMVNGALGAYTAGSLRLELPDEEAP